MKTKIHAINFSVLIFLCVCYSNCNKKDDIKPAPTIASFSPVSGIIGASVTITGKNFSATVLDNTVKFNGIVATVSSATPTQLVVIVPANATTGKISVEVNGLTATSTQDFTILLPPIISSFSPAIGIVGSTVTIVGTNFSTTPASNTVKFNGIAATVSSATATQLVVTVPANAVTGKISVDVNGLTATSATDFTAIPPPTLTGFTPTSGIVGTSVTLTGTNFSTTPASNTVKFNGTSATVSSATATQLVVTVPTNATIGKISVDVNGLTTSSTQDFTILLSPTITSFTPISGIVGTSITINGTNFSSAPASNTVKFNGTAATVSSATATQLVVTVPTNATTGKISVDVNGLTATSTQDFTVLLSPTITSFTPASGIVGTSVTIIGTNFSTTIASNTIKFNGTTAIVSSATTTQLVVTVPANATTGKISVDVNGLTASSTQNFTVIQLPTITSFTPANGILGSTVTITGTNFSTTLASNTVKFNGTAAIVSSATTTQLVVTIPANATTGKISVAVNGFTATSTQDFSVIPPPTITSFTPTSGIVGTSVTITGTNFSTTAASNTVKFNGTSATVSSATSTQLVVTVPANAVTGKITVDVNGLTATSATDFTVIPPPTLTGFTPTSGIVGTSVTITGTNFSTTPASNTVKFNGTSATVNSSIATQLVVTVPTNATTGKISVVVNGITATSTQDFAVIPPPVVSSFSPTNGASGNIVTINGANFSTTASNNIVKFNGSSATVNSATATQLTVTVPVNVTTGKITVIVNGLTTISTIDFIKFICGVDQWIDPRDGKLYWTVLIGSQCWMSQNLNHGTFINTSTVQSNNGTIEKYGYNNTDDTNQWGAIYLWNEVMQYSTTPSAKGVCPSGWHIPSDPEWKILEISLGMSQATADLVGWRGTDQGTKLRGSSGFGSIHSGMFENPSFILRGNSAVYWTSTQNDATTAWQRDLWDGTPLVDRVTQTKGRGLYVRCVKD